MSDEIKDHEAGAQSAPSEAQPQIGESYDYNKQQDAVFGELHEGGPNYRNVGLLLLTACAAAHCPLDRMARNCCHYDEASTRSGRPFTAVYPQYPRHDPWCDLHLCHGSNHNLVCLYRGHIQDAAPFGVCH